MTDLPVIKYGLVGFPLGHSFSSAYFNEKFRTQNITGVQFKAFNIPSIESFPDILVENPSLQGLTITMPYKQSILNYVDELDVSAKEIQSVNALRIIHAGGTRKIIGYNTDIYGFECSIRPLLSARHKKALILGTGGASISVNHVLTKLGLQIAFVSRTKSERANVYTYEQITAEILNEFTVVVNTTPLGMSPLSESCPPIPTEYLCPHHLVFDLIYNPEKTPLLQAAEKQGCTIKNGLEMLYKQADKAWEIWNR